MKYDCTKVLDYCHEVTRMCQTLEGDCGRCDFYDGYSCYNSDSSGFAITQKMIDIVQKWSNENPEQTRKEKFLEQYPTSDIRPDGILNIKPCWIDKKWTDEIACETISCVDCGRKYWNEVVE